MEPHWVSRIGISSTKSYPVRADHVVHCSRDVISDSPHPSQQHLWRLQGHDIPIGAEGGNPVCRRNLRSGGVVLFRTWNEDGGGTRRSASLLSTNEDLGTESVSGIEISRHKTGYGHLRARAITVSVSSTAQLACLSTLCSTTTRVLSVTSSSTTPIRCATTSTRATK